MTTPTPRERAERTVADECHEGNVEEAIAWSADLIDAFESALIACAAEAVEQACCDVCKFCRQPEFYEPAALWASSAVSNTGEPAWGHRHPIGCENGYYLEKCRAAAIRGRAVPKPGDTA